MNKTTAAILSVGLFIIIALGVAVKMIWFPTIKDIWFEGNGRSWHLAPPGLVVVRPTHFPHSATNSLVYNNGELRLGRNVTFQQLFATAYQYNPALVSIPDGAPTNGFDILITATGDYSQKFKDLILRKTGYTADVETHDADVLALKVVDLDPPYRTLSAPDEKMGGGITNGRLYLMHVKINSMTDGLGRRLKTPVVDETGLSNNFYDLSLKWSRGMNPNKVSRQDIDKILADWGLAFQPDTATMQMLVVKRKY